MRRPVLDDATGIAFNGDATTDLAGDPMHLLPPETPTPARLPLVPGGCVTHRKPYDLAVACVLLRVATLVPDALSLSSSGVWQREWDTGASPAASVHGMGARPLVAELFDTSIDDNPLRERAIAHRFTVGQAVHVNAFGTWRAGHVTHIGRALITVRYTRTDGSTVERRFPRATVYPAAGMALVPVDELRRGHVIVRVGGLDLIVDTAGPGRPGHRVVRYTDGTQAQIAAHTVMRVRAQPAPDAIA